MGCRTRQDLLCDYLGLIMTLANILFIAFIMGFILGFICCLFLIYLIRREMEQVAEGERVAIKNCEINRGKK